MARTVTPSLVIAVLLIGLAWLGTLQTPAPVIPSPLDGARTGDEIFGLAPTLIGQRVKLRLSGSTISYEKR